MLKKIKAYREKFFFKTFRTLLKKRKIPQWGQWPVSVRNMTLAASVGLVVGLLASALYMGIEIFSHYLFYDTLRISRDLLGSIKLYWWLPWLVVFVPALGGLIVGWIGWRYCQAALGAGTSNIISAFHFQEGRLSGKEVPFKWLTSCVSIGTGSSGGAEGPVAHIGAAAGSWLAQKFSLGVEERRLLLIAGIAAGIGAIFRAPLGGALFASEIFYSRAEVESEAVVPSLISSVSAYTLFGLLCGFEPLLSLEGQLRFSSTSFLGLTLLALAAVLGARIFTRLLAKCKQIFSEYPLRFRPALGGLCTGGTALWVLLAVYFFLEKEQMALSVLGQGYQVLQQAVLHPYSWIFLIFVIAGKILTTSFSIGSGNSAGVFAPSMIIGGCIGALIFSLLNILGYQAGVPAAYVLAGMSAFFAAATACPLASVILITELAPEGYRLLPALMWVVGIAYLLRPRPGLFPAQLESRADSPAHRQELGSRVLRKYKVEQAMIPLEQIKFFQNGITLENVINQVRETRQEFFPVVDSLIKYQGGFLWSALNSKTDPNQSVNDLITTKISAVLRHASLDEALRLMLSQNRDELPVVDKDGVLTGIINRRQIWVCAMERK
jgi:chloride channel protein, CIC family